MVDNADLIELFEVDLDRLIMVGHKQGLTYVQIFLCILDRLKDMVGQCPAEQWLNQTKTH